jgi:2-dehydropantoate 2-reductase
MGSLYGGLLAGAGNEVWLVGRSPAHAAAIEAEGLRITHGGEERLARPRATTDPAAAGEVELLMIWVKSHDTATALAGAAPMIGPGTIVASFQNGLGNVEPIAARVAPERVVYGVSTIGGEIVAPGRLEVPASTWDGTGITWMGVLVGAPERLEPLRAAFAAAGIRSEIRPDIETIVWSKLALAAPMTALSALTRLSVGGVLENPELADLQRRMTAEVVAVAQAKGIPLALDEALRRGAETYEGVPEHLPSMLQDVLAGRPTEIEALSGAVAREAERAGVEAPLNDLLARLVRGVDLGAKPPRGLMRVHAHRKRQALVVDGRAGCSRRRRG